MSDYFMEEANETAKKRARALRLLAELAMPICQAASEFDGRVYNKRFANRIRELTDGKAYAKNTGYSILIAGYSGPYTGGNVTLMQVGLTKLKDEKRISAQLFADSAIEYKHKLLKQADEIIEYMDMVPEIRSHVDRAMSELNDYLGKIPSDIHDIYRIPYVLRTA